MRGFILTTPDGQRVKVGIPAGATPEQVDAKIAEIKAQLGTGSTTSTPTSEMDPLNRSLHRPLATAAGGTIGGTGATLAALPSAAATGPVGPYAAGLAGAGLGAGIGGQTFDLAESVARRVPGMLARWQLGRDDTDVPAEGLSDVAGQVGSDVLQGLQGEAMGQATGAVLGAGYSGVRNALAARRALRNPDTAALEAAAQRQEIPLGASDVTQSRTVRRIENFPSYFTIGGGRVQSFREGQRAATEAAARRVSEPFGPGTPETVGAATRADVTARANAGGDALRGAVDPMAQAQADALTTGLKAQGGARTANQAFRQQSQVVFDDINQLAGPDPVVGTNHLRSQAEAFFKAGQMGSQPAVPQASRLSTIYGLSDQSAALLDDAVVKEKIPFAVARQLEAELGDVAFRGPAIGGPRAGQLKALYAAVRKDLDDYLTSPEGDTVNPALAAAKQFYATGKQLFNNSARRIILGSRNQPLAPSQVVRRAFRPGAIEDTVDFKLLTDDETYGQAAKTWLSERVEKATVGGRFRPERFARDLARYDVETDGIRHLDVILPPQMAQQVRALAQGGLDEAQTMNLLTNIAPQRIVKTVFAPGAVDLTRQYRAMVSPETYQQAQSVFLDDLMAQSRTGEQFSPAKYATNIRKYDRRGHLDEIVGPAFADQMRDVRAVSEAMVSADRLAGNPSGTAQGVTSVETVLRPARKLADMNFVGAAADTFGFTGLPALWARGAFSDSGRQILGGQLPDLAASLGPLDLRNLMLRATGQGLAGALGQQP